MLPLQLLFSYCKLLLDFILWEESLEIWCKSDSSTVSYNKIDDDLWGWPCLVTDNSSFCCCCQLNVTTQESSYHVVSHHSLLLLSPPFKCIQRMWPRCETDDGQNHNIVWIRDILPLRVNINCMMFTHWTGFQGSSLSSFSQLRA